MLNWIQIKKPWELKPSSEGLELSNFEKKINLDLSNTDKNKQEYFHSILIGNNPFDDSKDNEITKIINFLYKEKVINYSNTKPDYYFRLNKKLYKLRKKFVSTKGPVLDIYQLNPKSSKFYPLNQHIFNARYISFNRYGKKPLLRWSSGISNIKDMAETKSIMESLERFACGQIDESYLIKSSMKQINKNVIDPTRLIKYSKFQHKSFYFPFKKFSPTKIYYWKKVTSLLTNRESYLPIDCIYYPITTRLASTLFTFSNSSGVAAGFNNAGILKRAILEIIERDAFMITWINRLKMPRINKDALDAEIKKRVREMELKRFKIEIINLTLDTIPVILICAISNKPPSLIMGAGADFSIHIALEKALSEVEMGVFWELRKEAGIKKKIPPNKVRSVDDHVLFYKSLKNIDAIKFLWSGKNTDLNHFSKFKSMSSLIKYLHQSGHEIFYADLTPQSFKNTDVKVYRAIISSFIPISFGYGLEPLDMERLKNIPDKLKLKSNMWKNIPLPHPFP